MAMLTLLVATVANAAPVVGSPGKRKDAVEMPDRTLTQDSTPGLSRAVPTVDCFGYEAPLTAAHDWRDSTLERGSYVVVPERTVKRVLPVHGSLPVSGNTI